MGKFFAALLGIIAGFLLAHILNETPEGRTFFARARATVTTFLRGVQDAYRP